MKKVLTRAASGIVYIALIVGAICLGLEWTSALMGIFAILATYEFHKITIFDEAYTPGRLAGFILAVLANFTLAFSPAFGIFGMSFVFVVIGLFFARFVLALYDGRSPSAFGDLAYWVLSVIYIGLPLMCASLLWYRWLLLALFVMIWLNDTGAYCVGCTLGRHKLFERLSPKKSWEGFVGGLLFCVLGAVALWRIWYRTEGNVWVWVGAGVLVCIASTWGDLFESLLKRTYHTKDAGHLIPGHGGILDRIDSLLFAAPTMLLYWLFCGAF